MTSAENRPIKIHPDTPKAPSKDVLGMTIQTTDQDVEPFKFPQMQGGAIEIYENLFAENQERPVERPVIIYDDAGKKDTINRSVGPKSSYAPHEWDPLEQAS